MNHRPTKLEQYIGQPNAKTLLEVYIKNSKSHNSIFPHTIITGKAGLGKTTLAEIIGNELGGKFFQFIASSIDKIEDIITLIEMNPNCVIFIDEIHGMDRKVVEKIYRVMEDFQFNGNPINRFTLLCATTELGELLKDRRPFYDRFKLSIQLEPYRLADIEQILIQYGYKVCIVEGNEEKIKEMAQVMGAMSKLNPRIAIKLFDQLLELNSSKMVARVNNIITTCGITKIDIKVLRYLSNNGICGLQGICAFIDIDIALYQAEIEPFLLQRGYITRTPRGRRITALGMQLAEELKEIII